jgi:hypothetical protein
MLIMYFRQDDRIRKLTAGYIIELKEEPVYYFNH